MQKIKSAALALPALLLAGCAAALPAENTATIETAAAAAPQTLKVYTSASLAPAAQAYAEAQGVALTLTDEAASADLLLTDHAPGGSLLDVTSDTLLAAAAARAGITENANALPLGRSLYGYWARADVLNALLGDGAAAALQTANWEEWSDFVETLSAWMAEPKAATVTLSGADYTLPDARPGSLTATGVFAAPLDRASGYTAALLAADGTYTADVTLSGGSGRASVESPAALTVSGGKVTAKIIWSSKNYDYMKVNDEKYDAVIENEHSTFEIPVAGFDWAMPVVADTTAMSEPHEIEYTLRFDSASIAPAAK